jgi:hypothetical protein
MKKDRWTAAEEKFLIENYKKLTKTKISIELKKSPSTITRKAGLLGLTKEDSSGKKIEVKSLVGMKSVIIDSRTTIYIKAGKDPVEARKKFLETYKYEPR